MPFNRRTQYQGKSETVLPFGQYAESATDDRWHQPFSDPVGTIRRNVTATLAVALIASGLFAPVLTTGQFQETVTEERWHQPFSEPVRIKPRLLEALQQVSPDNPFGMTQLEIVTYSRFGFAWSEPVRIKPRLLEAYQPFLVQNPGVQFPENIFVSDWFINLSDPVRFPLRLIAAANQVFPENPFGETRPETVSFDRFGFAWSEPVRRSPFEPSGYLRVANQPFFTIDPFAAPEPHGGTSRHFTKPVFPGYHLPDPMIPKPKPVRPVWDYGGKVEKTLESVIPPPILPPPEWLIVKQKPLATPPTFDHLMPSQIQAARIANNIGYTQPPIQQSAPMLPPQQVVPQGPPPRIVRLEFSRDPKTGRISGVKPIYG